MTDEQVKILAGAIRNALGFQNADAFEHVFGPSQTDFGVAGGLREIASAIRELAEAIRERGSK